jgi:hypothetical protein
MIFIYILLGIIALLIILAIVAPKVYDLRRSIVVNRSLQDTFQYLKYIKNQDEWSPWKKKDPNMTQTQTGTDGTVGFVSRWEGNKDVGVGEQEIVKIYENERIDSQLRFFKPWKSESDAYLTTKEVDASNTEVTWGFSGVNKVPFNIMMLFFSMEKTVGKDFEEGLASLKEILEA